MDTKELREEISRHIRFYDLNQGFGVVEQHAIYKLLKELKSKLTQPHQTVSDEDINHYIRSTRHNNGESSMDEEAFFEGAKWGIKELQTNQIYKVGCINSLGCACKEANGHPLTDCNYWQGD